MKIRLTSIGVLALLAAGCGSGTGGGQAEVNLPPTVAAIPDQVTVANAPAQPIAVDVSDERPGTLSVTATSTDQDVVADQGIAVSGGGDRRTITLTPAEDVTGDSRVTVIVRDHLGLSASTSFLVSVRAEQKSMQAFARKGFAAPADGDPQLINAIGFDRDAEADTFDDLFAE